MKKIRTFIIATTALTAATFATAGISQAQMLPDAQPRISWSQLTKQLEDKGFVIREIKRKSDGFKVEALDRNYTRYELRLNLQGEIVRQRSHN